VRKGEIAADIRGYTAEMVAKAASQGALDAPLAASTREVRLLPASPKAT
jgi:monoamine oxidase